MHDSGGKNPLLSFIAGGFAGGVEASATYPFEFAKTRVQLKQQQGESTPKNPFKVITNIVRRDGFRSLYTGCTTLVVGTVAKDSLRFLCFEWIKDKFKDPVTGTLSPMRSFGSGLASGVVVSTFAVTPTERIKTALIDDARNGSSSRFHRSPWMAAKVLLRDHGPLALYRGYVTTTLKSAGTTSVRLGSYNVLKDLSVQYNLPQNSAMDFLKGMAAGVITTYATQPVDTVKTRAQSAKGMGVTEAMASVWQDYGVKGFWRGTTMRLGRTIFAGGILFTVYEEASRVLHAFAGHKIEAA
jgi:solute carrier family 25 (mitochondrial citrate transporter), member 1